MDQYSPHTRDRLYELRMKPPSQQEIVAGFAWFGKAGLHGDEIHYLCGPQHPETMAAMNIAVPPLRVARWSMQRTEMTWNQWRTRRKAEISMYPDYVYIIGHGRQVAWSDDWAAIAGGYQGLTAATDVGVKAPQIYQGLTHAKVGRQRFGSVMTMQLMPGPVMPGIEVWTEYVAHRASTQEEADLAPAPGWRRGANFDTAAADRALVATKPPNTDGWTRYAVDLDRYYKEVP